MSSLIYPKDMDLQGLSIQLLWHADWPNCMECAGPLTRAAGQRSEVKNIGSCKLDMYTDVRYVCMVSDFFCLFCAERHELHWYFFYSAMGDGRHQLVENFWGEFKAPRLKKEKLNWEAQTLLQGMVITR